MKEIMKEKRKIEMGKGIDRLNEIREEMKGRLDKRSLIG